MNEKTPDAKSETREFLGFLVKLALFMLVLRSFIISPFNIPSESMQPRLLVGDYLFVSKWSYGYSRYSLPYSVPLIPGRIFASTPERGDVAVFKAPPTATQDYIKRVIGLPGDIIQVKNGIVILNGTPVKREKIEKFTYAASPNSKCYEVQFQYTARDGTIECRYPQYRETLPNGKSYNVLDLQEYSRGDDTEVFVVPEKHLFMMGDNRDNSGDSRFPATTGGAIGMVPEEYLVGKAMVSIMSTDGSASWVKPWTWFTAARWSRIGEGF